VICTLGNFATKLLSGRPEGITRVHGKPQPCRIGRFEVQLFPIYHPAAALYTPTMLETLRQDFKRLPALLAGRFPADEPAAAPVAAMAVPDPEPEPERVPAEPAQLGLF
jgi:DNA polymerase